MRLEIEYFAILREQAGRDRDVVDTTAGTPGEVYAQLVQRYDFDLDPQRLRVAVNDRFAAWDHPLGDGDRLVFIPPVAGG